MIANNNNETKGDGSSDGIEYCMHCAIRLKWENGDVSKKIKRSKTKSTKNRLPYNFDVNSFSCEKRQEQTETSKRTNGKNINGDNSLFSHK